MALTTSPLTLCICIITYHRPRGLLRLFDGLNALRFEATSQPDIHIIVVDNDPDGSARTMCKEISLRWPVHYAIEPRRGIPQARNRSVQEALKHNPDFLAFIDDDEVPDPSWLAELMQVQRTFDADVVAGPALPYFEQAPPSWVLQSKAFEHLRFDTGVPITTFATNNVLLNASLLQALEGPFDERFALTGGTDVLLGRQLYQRGCNMRWADAAITYECIPDHRVRLSWLMQRAYRTGLMLTHQERIVLGKTGLATLPRLIKGAIRMLYGFLSAPFLLAGGISHAVHALQSACRGAGQLAGVLGLQYEEYHHTLRRQ